MINWLRRLICGECDCSKREGRSKYAPERDIDTVQTGKKERPEKENMGPDYDIPAAMVIEE